MIKFTFTLTGEEEENFLKTIYQHKIKNQDVSKKVHQYINYFLDNINKDISNKELRALNFVNGNNFKSFMDDNLNIINSKLKENNLELVTYSILRQKFYKVIPLDD